MNWLNIRKILVWTSFIAGFPVWAADPGVTANSVTIGQTGVFSGPSAGPALQYRAGAQIFFDALNAKGGIYGRKIQLVSYDDKFDAKLGAANTKMLLEKDKVFAFFGYVGTGSIMASMPMINAHHIPVIGAVSGTEVIRGSNMGLIFHTRASYANEIEKMLIQLKTTGVSNIAVVYEDDPFGKAGMQSAKIAFERQRVNPVIEQPFDVSKLDALGPVAEKVAKLQPTVIILITAGKPTTAFIKAYLKTGAPTQFFGISVISAETLVADLGENSHGIVISQVTPSPFRGSLPIAKEFLNAAQKANSKDISYNSLEGYINAKVFAEALQRAGKDPSREKLVSALESMHNLDLGGYLIDFSSTKRTGSDYVDLSIIGKGGQFLH